MYSYFQVQKDLHSIQKTLIKSMKYTHVYMISIFGLMVPFIPWIQCLCPRFSMPQSTVTWGTYFLCNLFCCYNLKLLKKELIFQVFESILLHTHLYKSQFPRLCSQNVMSKKLSSQNIMIYIILIESSVNAFSFPSL